MATKKRILLVDDEAGILKVVAIQLNLRGYEAISTTRGEEAVEIVRTRQLDVILLDILMPGMNGLEVLERVREFSQVPVVAFTADLQMAEKAVKIGAIDYILKPFNPDRLVKKIRSVLAGARAV
jgi:DNA-binding response OmpR family regulator